MFYKPFELEQPIELGQSLELRQKFEFFCPNSFSLSIYIINLTETK